MTDELANYLVRPLLARRPLPWTVDFDWTVEVIDAGGCTVIKLMTLAHAQELIAFAVALDASDKRAEAEVKKLLAEHGIEESS